MAMAVSIGLKIMHEHLNPVTLNQAGLSAKRPLKDLGKVLKAPPSLPPEMTQGVLGNLSMQELHNLAQTGKIGQGHAQNQLICLAFQIHSKYPHLIGGLAEALIEKDKINPRRIWKVLRAFYMKDLLYLVRAFPRKEDPYKNSKNYSIKNIYALIRAVSRSSV